ncbi:hypothetical protein BDV95DRAFT_610564 [Massariosphaeria phaeospora]|uniref:Uncharacterized protein n=1 Tax=Massariosphaeria phaeospora TaxID=100035 RepID=A0A7C8I5D2_9PLEO|nr:hypothetical protein BDV95DRAFT_610564 [Massariosphaeria phaeospora]
MSGDANIHRTSWKVEAIRRGDLKISGPVPITEETPLTEDEERDYAEKVKVEDPPLLQDASGQQNHEQLASTEQAPTSQSKHPQQSSEQAEVRPPTQQDLLQPQHKRLSATVREMSEMQRRTPTGPASINSPSPFPSIPDGSMKTSTRRKRKSGLRNVFRKMFGRKGKEEPLQEEAEPVPVQQRGHGHHVSDPGLLRQSPKQSPQRQHESPSGPRISDLPVRELEPMNPLGQHLPFPMNVNAPQETSPPMDYLTFALPSGELGRRRATLPSVLTANDPPRSAGLAESQRRLSTWEEQHDAESIPSPQIGVALSSPSHAKNSGQSIKSKRRSRSAGALRDLAKAHAPVERRRSAEIRYWRSSYASGSVYSAQTPRPQTARTVDTVGSMDTEAKAPELAVESYIAQLPTVAQHDQDISEIQLPVEAFDFGNLMTGFSDGDEHTAKEVEHSESTRSTKRLSIDDRVKQLEENMRELETSVHRISGRGNRQTIILENPPKGRRSRNRSSSATSDRPSSHRSSRGSTNTLHMRRESDNPPSPGLAPLSAVRESPSSSDRRQTVVATNPRPISTQQSEIAEQLAAVYEALRHERGARKTLQVQVMSLQRELANLHALVHKLVSASPSYPTPSPDGIIISNEERLTTPRASTRDARGLGIDAQRSRSPRHDASRFSQSDRDSDHDHGGDDSTTSSREDIASPEDWATPKEESGFGSGFFHHSRSREAEAVQEKDDDMF